MKGGVMQGTGQESLDVARKALVESIARWTDKGEKHPRAQFRACCFFVGTQAIEPISGRYEPCVWLVAQGSKRLLLRRSASDYPHPHPGPPLEGEGELNHVGGTCLGRGALHASLSPGPARQTRARQR
jgi:hypothetical protein